MRFLRLARSTCVFLEMWSDKIREQTKFSRFLRSWIALVPMRSYDSEGKVKLVLTSPSGLDGSNSWLNLTTPALMTTIHLL